MIWEEYPASYRSSEIDLILKAVRSGQSVALLGLSGAGKSNLLGFLVHRAGPARLPSHQFALVDFNRLPVAAPEAVFAALRASLQAGSTTPLPGPERSDPISDWNSLEEAAAAALTGREGLCLLLDRFDALAPDLLARLSGNLRALRDAFKYRMSYVIAARRPPDPASELAELFYAHTLWLGPLAQADAEWSARRDLARFGLPLDAALINRLVALSAGYPSFLRAAIEAYAGGAVLDDLPAHPAVQHRVAEFWADRPNPADLERTGLAGHPFLGSPRTPAETGSGELTALEHRLWVYLQTHAGQVCAKDDLIRAVWVEDKVYLDGIRDDSLAQLVRRLRKKVETDPDQPHLIQTAPGRGYIFRAE